MGDFPASASLAGKFADEKDENTPYRKWIRAEGLDILPAYLNTQRRVPNCNYRRNF
jgi:hypothetical protein